MEITSDVAPGRSVRSTGLVIVGAWCHYAVVAEAGEHRLYINGMLIGSVPVPKVGPNAFKAEWGDVCVGATHQRHTFLNGRVDELAFYNRALDASEIKRIYELSTGVECAGSMKR